jgi:hypothetical protein
MNGRTGKHSYKEHTDASQAVTRAARASGTSWRPEERGAPLTIDHAVLRERMQSELDRLGLAGDLADQLVRELNFLACLLIDVAEERRFDD